MIEEITNYVLGLNEPLSIDDFKPLIGKSFDVDIKKVSWGNEETITDKLIVTNIKLSVDVSSEKTVGLSAIMIYSDYCLNGVKKYNAWTTLVGFKNHINPSAIT